MFLETLICGGQFLCAFRNTLLKVLREFFEVRIGSGVVDGRGHVAGDRQEHVEIFFRAGVGAPVCGEISKHLGLTLERHCNEGRHAGAANQIEYRWVYTIGYGLKAQDEQGFAMNQQIGLKTAVVVDRHIDMTSCLCNILRDSGDLGHISRVSFPMPQY